MTVKEEILRIVDEQPDDSSFDEILKELAFNRMIKRGLDDIEQGRITQHKDLVKEMSSWRKK